MIKEPQHRSTLDVIHSHVSVRKFTDEPINDDLLATLIEAGTRASTSSNMQAYTIISITEPDHKNHLAKLCADQQQIHQSAAFLACCADMHRLELCTDMHDEEADFGITEATVVALVDTALVMQTIAIAAESVGLGICMIGAMRNHPHEIRDALKLPKHVFPMSGLCLGWPAEKRDPKLRLPLDAIWHRERYRSDDELKALIQAYDGMMAAYFEEHGMHPAEPRWSAIMAQRCVGFSKRLDVGNVLREQGLNNQK